MRFFQSNVSACEHTPLHSVHSTVVYVAEEKGKEDSKASCTMSSEIGEIVDAVAPVSVLAASTIDHRTLDMEGNRCSDGGNYGRYLCIIIVQ